jgi:hypothetical protein
MLGLRHLKKLTRAIVPMEALATGTSLTQMHGASQGATGSVYNVGAATNIKFHEGMVPR